MEDRNRVWLEVWREACRHIEIERSVGTLAAIVARELPIDAFAILRFDWTRGTVELAAHAGPPDMDWLPATARELRTSQLRALRRWIGGGEVITDASHAGPFSILGSPGFAGDDGHWCAGPLTSEHGIAGAVVMRAHSPARFQRDHLVLVTGLLEPLSAALENDSRLRELRTLREAAQAETRSALTRLGRDGLIEVVVGATGGLAPVFERVDLVATSDIPVLILGETGSGKEVVARAIHDGSTRSAGPFIRVNCGAIPAELIDSELFGHEKGAFTGAAATRRGWFERADKGTLLLDEIGEMPLAAQVRLLRVLQEGTFERVGGEDSIRVDVRVVAATHRDLPALVQAGRFREDLWYRIAGFPIVLPPLRERKQDIAALVNHFAQRAAKRFGLRPQLPTAADLALLAAYDWPGNVRELASVIDRAAILGDGERLDVAKALGVATLSPPSSSNTTRESAPGRNVPPSTVVPLEEAMRAHIEAALVAARGRIEGPRGAAALLEINPHTLRARMRKLGLEWARFRNAD